MELSHMAQYYLFHPTSKTLLEEIKMPQRITSSGPHLKQFQHTQLPLPREMAIHEKSHIQCGEKRTILSSLNLHEKENNINVIESRIILIVRKY